MALSYCSPVRLLLWIILAFLVLFAFAAPNTEWIAWLLGVILLAIFLMLDAMFSNPADFVFDPSVSEALCWMHPCPLSVSFFTALGTFCCGNTSRTLLLSLLTLLVLFPQFLPCSEIMD